MKNLLAILKCFIVIILMSCRNDPKPEAGYKGEDVGAKASIERNKHNKQATFISRLPSEWKLYAGPSTDSIDFSKEILSGNGSGKYLLDIPTNKRYYFELVTSQGSAILAERHLPMEGGFNFRDLGGYRTANNRYIKWGKIFRSDDLGNLTTADLNYLSSVPLVNVIDFRSPEEIKASPDKQPASLKNDFHYSITPGSLTGLLDFDGRKIDEAMMRMNELLVSDSAAVAQYRKMFDLLQNPDGYTPLLYHCTAGKDRTGMATALILYALDVDEKTIMNDYLMSNKYIETKFADYIKIKPQLKSLFSVKREFLQAGINKIKKDNGTVENFLTGKLNVDISKFRKIYVY